MTESDRESAAPAPPARRPRRRLDLTLALAVVLPLATGGLALLAGAGAGADPAEPGEAAIVGAPSQVPLTRADLICPGIDGPALVAGVGGTTGEAQVRAGATVREVEVTEGTSSEVSLGERAVVVSADGDLAPGLVAGRFDEARAATECRPPVTEQWFTGVGSGARHRSVLQLVNPDQGRATVDVVVHGRGGPLDVPSLRGVVVGGESSRSFDLAAIVPRPEELALHVIAVRGRVGAGVLDRYEALGGGRASSDGLGGQDAPARDQLLLGLPGGTGPRALVVLNPGDDEVRATLELVTTDASFTPVGLEPVAVPPGGVVRVPLKQVLQDAAESSEGERALGLRISSTGPVTASLSAFVGGDLLTLAPTTTLREGAALPLPEGGGRLLVAGASRPGVVTVSVWDGAGEALPEERVEVAVDGIARVDLPEEARLLVLRTGGTAVSASLTTAVSGDRPGSTAVRLHEQVTTGLVPAVRVGLP